MTADLTSKEQRIGKWVYQVFYTRTGPQKEAFRVEIGSYENAQLVKDWVYGIVLEKDMGRGGKLDYVWYGGDDTGQRLLWFLSKDNHYDCVDVFKTAEAAWSKRFGRVAPDLGEVGGEDQLALATWDETVHLLNIMVEKSPGASARKVRLRVAPNDFVKCRQRDIGSRK